MLYTVLWLFYSVTYSQGPVGGDRGSSPRARPGSPGRARSAHAWPGPPTAAPADFHALWTINCVNLLVCYEPILSLTNYYFPGCM